MGSGKKILSPLLPTLSSFALVLVDFTTSRKGPRNRTVTQETTKRIPIQAPRLLHLQTVVLGFADRSQERSGLLDRIFLRVRFYDALLLPMILMKCLFSREEQREA